MKLRTLFVAGAAAAAGYVFGTRAGRARFEQLKARAGELAHDPRVRSQVSNLAGEVRKNAEHLPDPVAGIVRTAADKVETVTKEPGAEPLSTPPSPTATSSTTTSPTTTPPTTAPSTTPPPPTTPPSSSPPPPPPPSASPPPSSTPPPAM